MISPLRAFLAIFLLTLCAQAASFSEADPPLYGSLSIGTLKVEVLHTAALIFKEEYEDHNFSLGLDVNLASTDEKIKGFDSVVLRRLEFDTGIQGIMYEPINNLTFASGLLIRDFSTLDRQLILPQNEGMGLYAYYLGDIINFETFGTWSHIYGARVSEDLFGMTFGQSIVADADGEKVKTRDGISKNMDPRTGYSVDVWAPLFGDFDFYSELAALKDAGSGYSTGFHWGYNVVAMNLSARVEGRFSGKGFAPGYFAPGYEMNPVDISSVEAFGKPRSGYLFGLSGSVLDYFDIGVAYEGYRDSDGAFSIDGWVRITERLLVSAYFKQPSFASYRMTTYVDGTLLGGEIRYELSPSIFIAASAKKGYDAQLGEVRDSGLAEFGYKF